MLTKYHTEKYPSDSDKDKLVELLKQQLIDSQIPHQGLVLHTCSANMAGSHWCGSNLEKIGPRITVDQGPYRTLPKGL